MWTPGRVGLRAHIARQEEINQMPDLCVLRELELGVAGADQWLACDDRCG